MEDGVKSGKCARNTTTPLQWRLKQMKMRWEWGYCGGSAIVWREQSTEETSIDHWTGENSGRGSRIYRRHRRPSLCARQGSRTDWSSFLSVSVVLQNVANSSDRTKDLRHSRHSLLFCGYIGLPSDATKFDCVLHC